MDQTRRLLDAVAPSIPIVRGGREKSWIYEFVGPRYDLSTIFCLSCVGSVVATLLCHKPIKSDLLSWLIFAGTSFTAAVIRALKPNRLRLSAEYLEVSRTWSGRRRVPWRDAKQLFVVTFKGKSGRTWDVVRCEYTSPRSGLQTISMPVGLGLSTLSLLERINEVRAVACGTVHQT